MNVPLVPFVAMWSEEKENMQAIEVTERYVWTGKPKDKHGISWVQYKYAPGEGKPLFGQVHTTRQVACMREKICQICGEKIKDLHWILNGMEAELIKREYIVTQTPPVCKGCVKVSLINCPHLISLGKSAPVLKVRSYSCVAAFGDLILTAKVPPVQALLKYGDQNLKRFCGRQLLAKITDWSVLDINQFLEKP